MRNALSIIHYEYKMQIMRIASWGVLAAAVVSSLLDDYPSEMNLHRLEFLTNPVYFVSRTMGVNGLPMAFGLLILLSNRFSIDGKTGVKSLIMAGSTTKGQYIFGKMIGNLCFTVTMFTLYLAANSAVYRLAASFPFSVGSLLSALAQTLVICVLPVSVFISFLSVSLPALMDVRLFYVLAAVLFILNTDTVGSAGAMPFYCITSGDLLKLIWQHPKWTFEDTWSIQANLAFLVGSGLVSSLLLFTKKRFWRHV